MTTKHHSKSPGSRTVPINQHPWFKKHFVKQHVATDKKKSSLPKLKPESNLKKGTRLPEQVNILTTLIVPVRSKKEFITE